MIQNGHLQVYELTLTTRSPLFIGSGKVCGKAEYVFDPRRSTVMMIDPDRFLPYLLEHRLLDSYEKFVFSGMTDMNGFFRSCSIPDEEVRALSYYTVNAADALDASHSLKEIHSFVRDAAHRVYVPGSSVKGALRTVLLEQMIEQERKGSWPRETIKAKNARLMQQLEGEYLNTLALKKDRSGSAVNDAVNSILRGIQISDSAPVPNNRMMLSGKTDVNSFGEEKKIPLCRECTVPGTEICFKLTIDRSVLKNGFTAETILAAVSGFDAYYNEYMSGFPTPRSAAGVSYDGCLILGGGTGFFAKSLAYPYLGFDDGLTYTADTMKRSFRRHKHEDDAGSYGISPHTAKYGQYKGKLYPYGVCEVTLR